MQTLLEVVGGIVALDVILMGTLGAAGAWAHRRALRPPRTPLSSTVINAGLVVAIVLAGTAVLTHGFHLMPGNQQNLAVGNQARRRVPELRVGRPRRNVRTVTSASKTVLPPSGWRAAEVGSVAASSRGTGSTHPRSPSVVTAVSVSATEIRLRWADVGRGTRYRIERSKAVSAGWTMIATTPPDVTTYSDAGIAPGTTYFYRVVATSPEGESAPSDVASSTTITLPASPATPTAVTASSTEIDLSWGDVGDETGFRVERSPDGATGWVAIATTGQGVTSYSDAQLSPGVTYFYRVFATNAGGDSLPSDVVSSTTSSADPASPAATGT